MFNLPLPSPLPLPAQPNLVTSHSTIPTLAVSLRRPIRNFGCRRRTLAVTQSPIASNVLLEAHPKSIFGLRHAVPYHVCCDLTSMLSAWAQTIILTPWVTHTLKVAVGAYLQSSRLQQRDQHHPSKPTTAKSFTPPSLPLVECTVSTPLPPMCCYWPIWPRSDQEIDRSAGCQRSDLWATQTLGHLARGSGSRWISNGLSLRRESIFSLTCRPLFPSAPAALSSQAADRSEMRSAVPPLSASFGL